MDDLKKRCVMVNPNIDEIKKNDTQEQEEILEEEEVCAACMIHYSNEK